MMKILIVEDSAPMRRMMRAMLALLTPEIIECGDGREALSAYTAHRPDLVLMDIKMKEMDGLSATRQIKDAYPQARVMIVTNYDDDALREAATRAGACHYVVKEDLLDVCQLLTASGPEGRGVA